MGVVDTARQDAFSRKSVAQCLTPKGQYWPKLKKKDLKPGLREHWNIPGAGYVEEHM